MTTLEARFFRTLTHGGNGAAPPHIDATIDGLMADNRDQLVQTLQERAKETAVVLSDVDARVTANRMMTELFGVARVK